MRISLNGKVIGLVAGVVAGLLFVLLGWQAFLILLGFSLLGITVGAWVDSRDHVKLRLKRFVNRVFHS